MNFDKLNLEFSNMQKTITKYNELLLEIRNKIKSNLKDVSKYELKMKNMNNSLEKEYYKLMIFSIKNETSFLENIIKDVKTNEQKCNGN